MAAGEKSDVLAAFSGQVLPKVYADLQPIVTTLRDTEKVDLVVALSHSGISDVTKPAEGEDGMIAANVSGIDVIISGLGLA